MVVVVLICVDGGVGGGWRLDVVGVEMGGEEVRMDVRLSCPAVSRPPTD